ncbi:MAG: DNA polymerase III subunit beta [Kiritimatiellia bacterium]
MKLTLQRSKLVDGLQIVQNVVAARSTIQILSNGLMKAADGRLQITATDLEITVSCSMDAKVEEEGSTTLPVKLLLSIVRDLQSPEIEIVVDKEDVAYIESGASSFKINGLSEADFPPLPESNGKGRYTIDQKTFKEMLRKTSYAASLDETRRVLNGVLLSFKEGKLTMVATDGRRLALVEQEIDFPADAEVEMVLPSKAVNELLHILADEGELVIVNQGNQVMFEFGEVVMYSRLIDGVYPNYRLVIPSGSEEHVSIEREPLLFAIRSVSRMTTDKSNSTRFTFADNQVNIQTVNQDRGSARVVVPIKYSGNQLDITFNPEYVMDPLRNLETDEVTIDLTDSHSPAVFRCNQPFLYVLMPLRTN